MRMKIGQMEISGEPKEMIEFMFLMAEQQSMNDFLNRVDIDSIRKCREDDDKKDGRK